MLKSTNNTSEENINANDLPINKSGIFECEYILGNSESDNAFIGLIDIENLKLYKIEDTIIIDVFDLNLLKDVEEPKINEDDETNYYLAGTFQEKE